MSESKFFVVCYADTVENYSRPSDDDDVFTISKDPKNTGWNNDGDCHGYGLTKQDALELANSANDCNRYKQQLEEMRSLAEKHLRLAATLAAALEKIEGQWVHPKAELEGWCKQPDCDFGPAPAGLPEHRQYCAFQIAHEALSLAREMGVGK
jgi:hypothetical protein